MSRARRTASVVSSSHASSSQTSLAIGQDSQSHRMIASSSPVAPLLNALRARFNDAAAST